MRASLLPDGRRLHLHHGPIDLVIEARGAPGEVSAAYHQAASRFDGLLGELVGELATLRAPVGEAPPPRGAVARRMHESVSRHRGLFVTPMAAVAGSVAEAVLTALVAGRALASAYVNNGGDLALHLTPGSQFRVGLVARIDDPRLAAACTLDAGSPVRGVATSGRGGRSHSLGIADAVTVLARDAPAADVAATLIANAVDVDHPAVERRPAQDLDDDSDLGALRVTTALGALPRQAVDIALDRGAARARAMLAAGHITAAALWLRGRHRAVGAPAAHALASAA